MSNKDEIRLSQLLTTFGPGSIMELPDKSVMLLGLDNWTGGPSPVPMRTITEPRLTRILRSALEEGSDAQATWIEEGVDLQLREPPLDDGNARTRGAALPYLRFPNWVVLPLQDGETRQRLLPYSEALKGSINKKLLGRATPIRWIAGCASGHIRDINWRGFVHTGGDRSCRQDLSIEDRGASGDPEFTFIHCACGQSRRLSQMYVQGQPLGPCDGQRPWLYRKREESAQTGCTESLRPLTRGAINNYYSQTLRLIGIPEDVPELERKVREVMDEFVNVHSLEDMRGFFRFAKVPELFGEVEPDALWSALKSCRTADAPGDTLRNPKEKEFETFGTGAEIIGDPALKTRLSGTTLDRGAWAASGNALSELVEHVVRIDRLCEVTALYGFTRIDPAPQLFDEQLDEIKLNVSGQPLTDRVKWLPAMEQFGEGIFLKFDAKALSERVRNVAGFEPLRARYREWQLREGDRPAYPGNEYVFVHTVSHLLIEQIALRAGYPSTSLSERLYVMGQTVGAPTRIGLLIYAAGGGSQGTLGGLTRQTTDICALFDHAIARIRVCSNDPICSMDTSRLTDEAGPPAGDACHACVFLPETSCERFNTLLDRRSVLEIVGL